MAESHTQPIREALGQALEGEVRRLDLLLARVWQALVGVGVVGGLIVWAVVPGSLGLAVSVACGLLLCWFTLYAALLGRGRGGRGLFLASSAIEGSMPWLFLLLATATQGSAYALGSWLPPMLFAALIVASTARLRPVVPVVLGLTGGGFYLTLYFVHLRGGLVAPYVNEPLYQPSLQVTRALSLAVAGIFGSVVTLAIRGAVGRAERTVRAQDLFGKYKLGERIASGGMGSVHKAQYCPEGGFVRPVAVKLLHPHLAEQEAFLTGFRNEAELCARLVHPNIVQVLDFGRTGSAYFLAMEFVDGLTLLSFMRRLWAAGRPIPSDLAAWAGREILAGLSYSHEGARDPEGNQLRVIHRDLCPHNVLLSRSGEIKISDFGIAKALRDANSSLTQTVAGHLGYMAPEQAQAAPLDERCDVFAVGVMCWELLAGRPLFYRGGDAPTLLALLAGEVPSVAGSRPDVPEAWDAVLAKAAAREPSARYRSAAEMSEALAALSPPGGRSPELAALIAVALEHEDPGWVRYAIEPLGSADATDRDAVTRVQ